MSTSELMVYADVLGSSEKQCAQVNHNDIWQQVLPRGVSR